MIYKKTATLLSACAEIGAISSGASDEQIAICRRFGELLGYSFQIKDDIFDYFKEANNGKPTGNDIREGKVTLPLIFALRSGGGEADEFRVSFSRKSFRTKILKPSLLLPRLGAGLNMRNGGCGNIATKRLSSLRNCPRRPRAKLLPT